jgi:hypothetical protein
MFRMKRTGEGTGDLATLDISAGGRPIGTALRTVTAEDLPLGEYRSVVLAFDNPQPVNAYESRIDWTGNASLAFDRVTIWKIAD